MISQDGKQILAVNGEIYNHLNLRATLGPEVKFKTHSDCEVVLPLVSRSLDAKAMAYTMISTRFMTNICASILMESFLLYSSTNP